MRHWPNVYLGKGKRKGKGKGKYRRLHPGESGEDAAATLDCPYCGAVGKKRKHAVRYRYKWYPEWDGWVVMTHCDSCDEEIVERLIPVAAPGQAK